MLNGALAGIAEVLSTTIEAIKEAVREFPGEPDHALKQIVSVINDNIVSTLDGVSPIVIDPAAEDEDAKPPAGNEELDALASLMTSAVNLEDTN